MVTKLTREQEEQLRDYVDRGVKIGLSTDRLVEKEVKDIVGNFYRVILKIPEVKVMIFASPLSVWSYINRLCGVCNLHFIWPYTCGNFDINIFQYYDYMFNVLKVSISDDLMERYKIWKSTSLLGVMYCFDDICLVSEKPLEIHRRGNTVHNDSGPAIKYSDGFSVYVLNGVRMKKEYVETRWDELDPKIILTEQNAEVRRELVRKIGIERIVSSLGSQIIDTDGDYELLLLNIDDNRRRPYLKMRNPSIGVYHIEGVHPNCLTVADAIKFRNGTIEKPVILT